ncbi:MAG: LEA type 2 family protein [Desulfobacterales bacterium]|nr:MAG: LEA type 2 family protein [Desulfobacterales bacterium]
MKRFSLKSPAKTLGLLVLIPLVFAGCAGFGKRLESPRITLADIRVQEVKMMETAFQVQLRVFNANDVPLEVNGLECELEINGQSFATGISNSQTQIPPYGTATVPLVVYSSVFNMFKSVYGLQNREQLEYRLRGKLRLGGGGFVPPVLPFKSAGEVSLPGSSNLQK